LKIEETDAEVRRMKETVAECKRMIQEYQGIIADLKEELEKEKDMV